MLQHCLYRHVVLIMYYIQLLCVFADLLCTLRMPRAAGRSWRELKTHSTILCENTIISSIRLQIKGVENRLFVEMKHTMHKLVSNIIHVLTGS